MGGFFGAVSHNDCISDVFFGTDYHSHLGTRRGGMTAYSPELGFQRSIHSIENSPFRTKFESDIEGMRGNICIGCISDSDPQPILVRSKLGLYAVCTVGIIKNSAALCDEILNSCSESFEVMSSGNVNSSSLIGALIAQKSSIVDGIRYAQEKIEGSMSLMLMTSDGIIAARDKLGRLPVIIGKRSDGFCLSLESFAFQKLGYETYRELLPGEIVKLTSDKCEVLYGGGKDMKICSFLWTYYGYPNSVYEGVTVETMRTRNGEIMAEHDIEKGCLPDVDYVCGVPDSGIPHAIGYANRSGIPFARPFIKYTPTWPRSFMPTSQSMRNKVAKMKLIPVHELIEGKKLLFVDDSIVRGTTSKRIVNLIREAGAKEIHMRISCPPFKNPCYFGTDIDSRENLIACRMSIDEIAKEIGADSLGYLSVENLNKVAEDAGCGFCNGCFTGEYPVEVPTEMPKDKFEFKIHTK